MRVALVGLGKIAQKAYLPVISRRKDIEVVLCTRNQQTLQDIAREYRFAEMTADIAHLAAMDIEAAFIHAATEAHYDIAKTLLKAGIHIFIDKPIAYSYQEAEELVAIAEKEGRNLMVGFNRRFAPRYKKLQEAGRPDIILMEKNRYNLPGEPRFFTFDDFIHVIDTLRFLSPEPYQSYTVDFSLKGGELYHLILRLIGQDYTAIGIMNRDNGITEEKVEVMYPGRKIIVEGLERIKEFKEQEQFLANPGSWEPVLTRRGFPQMIDMFINSIREKKKPEPSARDSLKTHLLCEKIAEEIKDTIT